MSERSLEETHGQMGMLLTLSAVRSRGHRLHSQADSAGSIPVTRSTREKRCSSCGFADSTFPISIGLDHSDDDSNDQWATARPQTPCLN
jgi:hypothetical protein